MMYLASAERTCLKCGCLKAAEGLISSVSAIWTVVTEGPYHSFLMLYRIPAAQYWEVLLPSQLVLKAVVLAIIFISFQLGRK